jgi:hypothetical protein
MKEEWEGYDKWEREKIGRRGVRQVANVSGKVRDADVK